jgi:hypothetical protein
VTLLKTMFIVAIFIPQFAFSSNSEAFKNLVNDYSYDMSVEWDQLDKDYASQKEQEFRSSFALLVDQGLTEEDMVAAFPLINVDQIKDAMNGKELSSQEVISEFIQNNSRTLYSSGASWNGDVALGITILVVFVTGLYLLVHNNVNQGCGPDAIRDADWNCQPVK